MVDITIVNGVYKPTYNWGAPSCMVVLEDFNVVLMGLNGHLIGFMHVFMGVNGNLMGFDDVLKGFSGIW